MIAYSETESSRFKMNIWRGKSEYVDLKELNNIIQFHDYDILIMRYPTDTQHEHFKLQTLPQCIAIHTDSLIYYELPISQTLIQNTDNHLKFEFLNHNQKKVLRPFINSIFKDYPNHYYSNPLLPKSFIKQGYLEWAESLFEKENHDTWVIFDSNTNKHVAFFICNRETHNIVDMVLGGCAPNSRNSGVFYTLIHHIKRHYNEQGFTTLKVSTQLQNIKAQRVYQKCGFRIVSSYETYHIINNNKWNCPTNNK